jgi:hypothetical protein
LEEAARLLGDARRLWVIEWELSKPQVFRTII